LKWTLAVVLALAALAWGGGLLLSPTFSVSRSVVMQAPPPAVYKRIADPGRWRDWSLWHRRHPAMMVTYFGDLSGGQFRCGHEGCGADVAWTMNGDMGRSPLFHWIALFADRLVGADFGAGLANLKAAVQGR
jgi:hypothetical protein